MNIRDINKPVNSKTLNETMAKKFGTKIDVASFTLEQLQDARNKIRTKQFDIETNESFTGLSQNRTYSKNKLFLDVLNAAISERADVAEAKKPDADGDGVPDWADKKPGKDDNADKKGKKPKKGEVPPQFQKESVIKEGAEDHAELVMAAKDMVDRLTGWMEDTAEMQTESMLELADAIRDEMGAQQSEGFTNAVKPALEQLYAAMESTRVALTTGVGMLTGEGEAPAADLGADVPGDDDMSDMDIEPTADMDMEPTADMDDEFGAAAPAAGGAAEAGREKRESKAYAKKKMIESSRRLGSILSAASR